MAMTRKQKIAAGVGTGAALAGGAYLARKPLGRQLAKLGKTRAGKAVVGAAGKVKRGAGKVASRVKGFFKKAKKGKK